MVIDGGKQKTNNLPTDVLNSIRKLKTIIKIIEDNLFIPKEDIQREITMRLGNLQSIRKIFSLYYPIEGISLSNYIVQRKKTEAAKAIKNLDNPLSAEMKVREIANCSKEEFNRMLKNNPTFMEAFDVDSLFLHINYIYDFLYKFNEEGLIKSEINRTKIKISERNWDVGLKMIFSMREYVYFEEDKDMNKLISYDMFLQNYEWMEDYIKSTKDYDPLYVIDYYAKSQKEFEEDKHERMMDFILYYSEAVKLNIGELTFYLVDRSKFKEVMVDFILPTNLSQYRSIIYKTKLALKLLGKNDREWYTYAERFKNILDDDLEKAVFSYFFEIENEIEEEPDICTIKNIYQKCKKTNENLKKEAVNNAIKNLILKGLISLKP